MEDGVEVGFYTAPGSVTELELPLGSLARASGPFVVRVSAEVGSPRRLAPAGVSVPFLTPPEPPGPVGMLRQEGDEEEAQFTVTWDPPEDNGGVPVDWYEVTVEPPPGPPGGAPLASEGGGAPAEPACEPREGDGGPAQAEALDERGPVERGGEPGKDDLLVPGEGRPPPLALQTEGAAGAEVVKVKPTRTQECRFQVSDLPAGSGPYHVCVRAVNTATLVGAPAVLYVSTAVAAPSLPTGLQARLVPGHRRTGGGASRRAKRDISEVSVRSLGDDVDVVRLDFRVPEADGGRDIATYMVYALEEDWEGGSVAEMVGSSGDPAPLATYWPEEVIRPGCGGQCACDVPVVPNRAYTFFIEAHNGVLPSGLCAPSASVFVPARVPLPPRRAPEVFRVQGGFAAELRWVGPLIAGGLPLTSFKVGIMAPDDADGETSAVGQDPVTAVLREVTVPRPSCSSTAQENAAAVQWVPPTPIGEHEAAYGARVDGLEADGRYCFVIAASNVIGTGRWSARSSTVTTPAAAPPTPANAVASVTVDDKQRVVVTVQWDCGPPSSAGAAAAVSAYHVTLMPVAGQRSALSRSAAASSSSSCPADDAKQPTALRERVVVTERTASERQTWMAPLTDAGLYRVELVAEGMPAGARSAPAMISLDVKPEAFPVRDPCGGQHPPQWADEPVLVLGPAAAADDTLFEDIDDAGQKLQTLLLWHEGDGSAAPGGAGSTAFCPEKPLQRGGSARLEGGVDVVCCYRKPGCSMAQCVVLAEGVVASRLQVTLPSHVPIALRLNARTDPVDTAAKPAGPTTRKRDGCEGAKGAKVRSEPLLLLLSENSEHLRPAWEVWCKNTAGRGPPQWTELPDELGNRLEVSWLEEGNMVKAQFEVAAGDPEGACLLPPGSYEITFGDDRQVQHCVRKLGPGGWTAKARRLVRDPTGEEAALPAVSTEEQCIICMERRRTHAFMHSDTGDGHLAVCSDCAEVYKAEAAAGGASRSVRSCPVCRRGFSAVQRIYA